MNTILLVLALTASVYGCYVTDGTYLFTRGFSTVFKHKISDLSLVASKPAVADCPYLAINGIAFSVDLQNFTLQKYDANFKLVWETALPTNSKYQQMFAEGDYIYVTTKKLRASTEPNSSILSRFYVKDGRPAGSISFTE